MVPCVVHGGMVVPGETHLLDVGVSLAGVDLDAHEVEEILGYTLDDLRLGRYPSRRELDGVTPENPLYIQRRDGHIGVVNSLALEAGGITKDTPDPPHGKIDRDESGEPTGVLRELAKDLVYSKIPGNTVDDYHAGLRIVNDEFLSLGLTTVHASMTTSDEFKALQRLKRDGELALRYCVHASGREDGKLADLVVLDRDPLTIPADDLKNVNAITTIVDGRVAYRRDEA